MSGNIFAFKQFEIKQDNCAMKVGTDAVLLGAWSSLPESGNILDIGTGTGVIAMMAAQRSPALIDAIEIDAEACQEAMENFKTSKWSGRIKLHPVSYQEFVASATKKYDAILSNPPYFSNSVQPVSGKRSLARHTSTLSFEELADGITLLLKPDGSFATILPLKEAENFTAIAKRYGLYPNRIMSVKTTFSKPVKRILLQFGFAKALPSGETLVIENRDHSYSADYKNLTRNFYLGF